MNEQQSVYTVFDRRHDARQPRDDRADVPVQRGRGHDDRLAPDAPRLARDFRRVHDADRGDRRDAGGPHHAPLHRPVFGGERARDEAHDRLLPQHFSDQDRRADRACGAQGVHSPPLGRAGVSQEWRRGVADSGAVRDPSGGRLARAARNDAPGHGCSQAGVRGRSATRGPRRGGFPRNSLDARLPVVRIPVAVIQPSHR